MFQNLEIDNKLYFFELIVCIVLRIEENKERFMDLIYMDIESLKNYKYLCDFYQYIKCVDKNLDLVLLLFFVVVLKDYY